MNERRTLSTADIRRDTTIRSAVTIFAKHGYQATPITDVAKHAGISPAYVFKLFPGKLAIFLAALDHCYDRILEALAHGAQRAMDASSSAILHEMGGAYAELIAERDLLMLQVHAQSAADDPEIAAAMRRGLERVTTFAKERSGATDAEVQQFMAVGQLCHLITTLNLDARDGVWAALLTMGIRHP